MKRTPPPPPPKPRNFLVHPTTYGRFKDVQWNPTTATTYPDAATAARWQHRIAVLTRVALETREITHEEFAHQMGREKQYLADRLNGQRWMSLLDAAFIANHLEVRIIRPEDDPRRVPVEWRTPPRRQV